MSTGRPRDPGKEQFWRSLIRRWQRSGRSVRRFCAEHHLCPHSFYTWRRLLQQRDAQALHFVPVEVVSDPLPAVQPPQVEAGLELVLGRDRLVRIAPGFDGPTLRRLLALLEEK
jgi:transposase-like protein